MPAEPIRTRTSTSTSSSGRRAVPVGGSNVYGATHPGYTAPRRKDNLFLWTVFLLGLVIVTLAVWTLVPYIFSHPEQPFNYNLLRRFKKVQAPTRFAVDAAPAGEFTTAGKLATRIAGMGPAEFRDFNAGLVRAYVRNFPVSAKQPTPYLSGRFTIMDSFALGPGDVFPSGVVTLATSAEDSKVLIEHVYSAPATTAPLIRRNLPTGTDIELQRTLQLTAVVHAERLGDGRLLLTVVPINYGSYGFKGTSSGFSLEPPSRLNLNAGWPILKEGRREEANQAFIAFRQRSGLGPLFGSSKKKSISSGGEAGPNPVTGIDAPPPAPPAPGEEAPAATVATVTAASGKPASPAPSPAAVAAAARTPAAPPAAGVATSPSPSAATLLAAASPSPPPTAPAPQDNGGVRVERALPVLRAAPANGNSPGGASLLSPTAVAPATNNGGNNAAATKPGNLAGGGNGRDWPTYAPGRQPAGRQLRAAEVASLGEQPPTAAGEPLYLNGEFVVSATGVNPDTGDRQAVLRPRDPTLFGRTRILVQYPKGRTLPTEGTELSRDAAHAYQITDVRRTADGQMLNVFAREVTTE